MSDLFHEDIPLEYIQKIFGIMNKASRHTFQVLTKRSDRLEELAPYLAWSPNIWQGVTIESDQYKYRIDSLRKVNAKVRFISFEPLIDEVKEFLNKGLPGSAKEFKGPMHLNKIFCKFRTMHKFSHLQTFDFTPLV
ncbi:Bacteriophage protein gp37 [Desulfosporosinus sp. I2]|uniref:DUF5131 family protein n=1 Tax=Desulfosporosinus sp. I2 TaxID=1617025 RepID=UPI00061FF97A|nr:DUF5131 family protein [Desulfosporosinus sp. I2]KJR45010.1 Bacteriophage protein gp37 [Desulfosporosinus sp. I2]